MATRLITQTQYPVGLAEAKVRLRIDDTGVPATDEAQDADIEAMIAAATQLAESMTRRSIATTQWRLTLDAFPAEIRLLHPPIVSVQSVQYIDANGTAQTLPATEYTVDTESEPGCILPAAGTEWPETMETANALTVNYTSGWGTQAPAAIKQFILLQVAHMYRNREAASEKPLTVVPYGERLLDAHKLWEV